MKLGYLIIFIIAAPLLLLIGQPVTAEEDPDVLVMEINRAYAADELLRSIHDLTAKGKITIERPGGRMEMPVTFFAEKPEKIKIVTQIMPHVDYIQAFDGDQAWIARAGELRYVPEAAVREIESLAVTFIDGWLDYQEKGFEIQAREEETDGGQADIVLEVRDRHGHVSRFYHDGTTRCLERMEGHLVNAEGISVPTTLYYEDYKNFHGLNLASRMRAVQDGNTAWEQVISSVALNTGFSENFFVEPVPFKKEEEEGAKEGDGEESAEEAEENSEKGKEQKTEEKETGETEDEKQNLLKEKPAEETKTKP